ncbi:hypothetical protein QAD02_005236 [Eretmocerus hayati]|uniref:Uncharacterized protein n=1 Tax=Eretmocerus hayati TaxID=131215 RepID=A0ACC2NRT8_9HYME|nr:hypothetical protein QAD02_005236 [Eretmocerus hayati]
METDVLKFLVRKGLNMVQIRARHSPQNSPIHRALRNPDLDVLHTLLKIGAGSLEDRDHLGYTTIYQAVRQRNINTVRYLIHRGAEVNTESARSTSLDYALLHKLQDEMKIILTRYTDPAIVKLKISQYHEGVTRPVIKAMLKRIATAPKLVDKEFFTFVTKYCYKFSVYFERCLSEVEILNSTTIGHESLYEVLTAKMCTMSWRWRSVSGPLSFVQYPIYQDELVEIRDLVNRRHQIYHEALLSISMILGLHGDTFRVVITKIMDGLDLDDLLNLAKI